MSYNTKFLNFSSYSIYMLNITIRHHPYIELIFVLAS